MKVSGSVSYKLFRLFRSFLVFGLFRFFFQLLRENFAPTSGLSGCISTCGSRVLGVGCFFLWFLYVLVGLVLRLSVLCIMFVCVCMFVYFCFLLLYVVECG